MDSLGETFPFLQGETIIATAGIGAILFLLLLFIVIFMGASIYMGWMTWNGFGDKAKPHTSS